jgi:hypothetical protein
MQRRAGARYVRESPYRRSGNTARAEPISAGGGRLGQRRRPGRARRIVKRGASLRLAWAWPSPVLPSECLEPASGKAIFRCNSLFFDRGGRGIAVSPCCTVRPATFAQGLTTVTRLAKSGSDGAARPAGLARPGPASASFPAGCDPPAGHGQASRGCPHPSWRLETSGFRSAGVLLG